MKSLADIELSDFQFDELDSIDIDIIDTSLSAGFPEASASSWPVFSCSCSCSPILNPT